MPCLAKECFWRLIASMTPEVKRNHAHVTTQCRLFQVGPRLLLWLLLIRWDSPLTVFRQSFGTLCAVFMGSLDGLQAVLESLQAVFWRSSRGLCAVFRHSMGLLGGLWAVYDRLQTIFEDPQEVLCCSLGSLWPVCSVFSVFNWSSGGFLICNQNSIFSNMEVERLFSLMI